MTITRHGEPLLPVIRNSAFSRLSAMRGRKTQRFSEKANAWHEIADVRRAHADIGTFAEHRNWTFRTARKTMRLVAESLGMVLGSPRVRNGAGRAQAVEHLLLASV